MLKILLKTRLISLLSRFTSGGKTSSTMALTTGPLIVLSVLGLAGGVGLMFVIGNAIRPFFAGLAVAGLEWLSSAIGTLVSLAASFMLTVFYAQNAIFEAKDNEMLLSMPISPSAILGSRMLSLFLLNLGCIAVLMGGLGVARLNAYPPTVSGIIIFVLVVLLLPFISTTLACLIAWLVSLVTRKMKQKAFFQLIFSLLFMVPLFLLFNNVNKYMMDAVANGSNIAETVRTGLPPFYMAGMAIAMRSWKYLAIFALICVVPFAILYFVLTKSFIHIATARPTASNTVYEEKELHASSVTVALMKKDITRLLNSSSYMLNAALGVPLSILIGVIALFGGMDMLLSLLDISAGSSSNPALFPVIGCMFLCMTCTFTYISAPSISVENKSLWIMLSMPITAKQALRSKLFFHLVLALPAMLIGSVLFTISVGVTDVMFSLTSMVIPLLLTVFVAELGLITNLYIHRFDYESEATAVKSGGASVITLLVAMVFAFMPLILLLVADVLNITLAQALLYECIALLVFDLAMWFFLNSKVAARKWYSLGNG